MCTLCRCTEVADREGDFGQLVLLLVAGVGKVGPLSCHWAPGGHPGGARMWMIMVLTLLKATTSSQKPPRKVKPYIFPGDKIPPHLHLVSKMNKVGLRSHSRHWLVVHF